MESPPQFVTKLFQSKLILYRNLFKETQREEDALFKLIKHRKSGTFPRSLRFNCKLLIPKEFRDDYPALALEYTQKFDSQIKQFQLKLLDQMIELANCVANFYRTELEKCSSETLHELLKLFREYASKLGSDTLSKFDLANQ